MAALRYTTVCLAALLALLAGPAAAQTCTTTTLHATGFEPGEPGDEWSRGFLFANAAVTNDWRGIQACAAHDGDHVFRFGGEACDGSYGASQVAYAATPALTVPAGSSASRLAVWHRRDFESGKDGGRLAVRLDGGSFFHFVQDAQIVSGALHEGTLDADCPSSSSYPDMPVFTGTTDAFAETVVDLDAVCDLATGAGGGCAGHAVEIGFLAFTDCAGGGLGWSLDEVTVTTCAPPPPTRYFTLTPCRLVDTRLAGGPLQPDSPRDLSLASACGVPATATALALNVTAVQPGAAGELLLSAPDADAGAAGIVAFGAGQTRANNAIVKLPGDGSGTVVAKALAAAPVDLVIDVVGYFE
jgi:hypothetical protein